MLWLSLAFAQQTRLFETDADARAWIQHTRKITRQRLPIVGPTQIDAILPWGHKIDVRVVRVPDGQDLNRAAMDARLEDGSACALVFTKAETGWAGWVSGTCGQLTLGAWQLSGDQVLDFRGHPLTVAQFAIATGDRPMLKTYRRLERRRGRALTFTLVGTGALWFSVITGLDESSALPLPLLLGVSGLGGGLTAVGVIDFLLLSSNPKAQSKNIGAYLDRDGMRRKVIQHNKRLRVFIGPGSAHGTF